MKYNNTAALSHSTGLAWQPFDWRESKATDRSHSAEHTVYSVSDELHPHREAINPPAEKEAQLPPLPLGVHSWLWNYEHLLLA